MWPSGLLVGMAPPFTGGEPVLPESPHRAPCPWGGPRLCPLHIVRPASQPSPRAAFLLPHRAQGSEESWTPGLSIGEVLAVTSRSHLTAALPLGSDLRCRGEWPPVPSCSVSGTQKGLTRCSGHPGEGQLKKNVSLAT